VIGLFYRVRAPDARLAASTPIDPTLARRARATKPRAVGAIGWT